MLTQLTKLQRRTLQLYRELRVTPPTAGRLMMSMCYSYLILFAAIAGGAMILFAMNVSAAAWLVIGIGVGAVCRDFGSFRKTVHIWPVLDLVLNWERIDELLDDG